MKIFALLFLLAYSAFGACSKISMPTDFSTVSSGTRANLKANFSETENKFNPCADSVDEVRARFSGYSGSLLLSSLENLRLRLDSDGSATSKFIVEGSNGDTLFRVSEDSTARFFGALTVPGLTHSALTASLPVFTNGSKALASNAMTGTGSVVMSASPTLTGTLAAASGTYSGTLGVTGITTLSQNLTFGAGGSGGAYTLYRSSPNGLAMRGGAGSTYDLALLAADGTVIVGNPTGTTGITMPTAVSMSSTLAVTGNTFLGTGGNTLVVGSSSSAKSTRAEIIGGTGAGAGLLLANTNNDATNKEARLKALHYTNAEEPMTMIWGVSTTSAGSVTIGGGSSAENASTAIDFYTAANNTTLSGTRRGGFNSSGAFDFVGPVTHSSTLLQTGFLTGTGGKFDSIAVGGSGGYGRLEQSFEVHSVGTNGSGPAFFSWSNAFSTIDPYLDFNRSRGTTQGDYTIVQSGDELGTIFFRGSNGTGFSNSVAVTASVAGTPGASDMPGRLAISVAPDGSATPSQVMRMSTDSVVVTGGLYVSGATTTDSLISRKFYHDTSFTVTLTGVDASVTGTARAARVGRMVTLYLPALTGTSNTTASSITGLPAEFYPARVQIVDASEIRENGGYYPGAYYVQTSGTIDLAFTTGIGSPKSGTFTASGTKGATSATIHYSLL